MIQIENALGILSSQVPIGNMLWVDAVNGVDALAKRGRMTIPFKTLTAAKNAARVAGSNEASDLIMVLPGIYNERNLLKDTVNWHFMPGAVVDWSGSDPGGIFDTGTYGTNSAVTSRITGYGRFLVTNFLTTAHIVNCETGSNHLYIEAEEMEAQSAVCVRAGGGSLMLRVKYDLSSATNQCVHISGLSEDIQVSARNLHSSGGECVFIDSGALRLSADRVHSSGGAAVSIVGGTGDIIIDAVEIVADTTHAINYDAPYYPTLTIRNARIISNHTSGYAVNNASGLNETIRLQGCLLITQGTTASIFSAGGGGTIVQCAPQCVANHAVVDTLIRGELIVDLVV